MSQLAVGTAAATAAAAPLRSRKQAAAETETGHRTTRGNTKSKTAEEKRSKIESQLLLSWIPGIGVNKRKSSAGLHPAGHWASAMPSAVHSNVFGKKRALLTALIQFLGRSSKKAF